ncbi:MAG: glycosyltransferase [Lachnospiraceae bacterium]|nr:glycosyltransferase [Lachnospiraceae bacterium]
MVRVLHVLGGLNLGGAESRIMDLYRHMDRDQVQFDFLVHTETPGFYNDEILNLGGCIYTLPRFKVYNIASYRRAARDFFAKHHEFNVIQGHMTSTASIYLPEAARYTCDKEGERMVTVAHTRNAGVDKGVKGSIVKAMRRSLPSKADYLFACSHLAGDETFGGAAYTYIPNTIDTVKFTYNKNKGNSVRDEYGIPEDAVVIGNVARFSPQKNQKFLIRAFAETGDADSLLMLCGDGGLKSECEALAKSLNVDDRVIFTGNQKNVWEYYSAMDIFAFPSEYEGLPGVVVEAQASGLKCIMSDTITGDVMVTDRIERLPISEGESVWSARLKECTDEIRNLKKEDTEAYTVLRTRYSGMVRDAGFDVNEQAKIMMKFYLDPSDNTLPILPGE